MLENFNKSMDNGNEFEALLTDLTKAFGCIDHKLLIARLFLYEISPTALNSIHSSLSTNRTQKLKIESSFSRRRSTEYGVPRELVLGPLLFNIDLTL